MISLLFFLAAAAAAGPYDALTFPQLKTRVLESDALAVNESVSRALPSGYPENPERYWEALDEAAELCETLLSWSEDTEFRRSSVETLFDRATTGLMSVIDLRPQDRRWVPRWKRFDGLLKRGLAHEDDAVRESFERYARKPSLTVEEARARAEAAHEALLELFPQERSFLVQSLRSTRFTADGMAGAPRRRLDGRRPRGLDDIFLSVNEGRMVMTWANAYPRSLLDRLGPQALAETGLTVEPAARVWPDYGPLAEKTRSVAPNLHPGDSSRIRHGGRIEP